MPKTVLSLGGSTVNELDDDALLSRSERTIAGG